MTYLEQPREFLNHEQSAALPELPDHLRDNPGLPDHLRDNHDLPDFLRDNPLADEISYSLDLLRQWMDFYRRIFMPWTDFPPQRARDGWDIPSPPPPPEQPICLVPTCAISHVEFFQNQTFMRFHFPWSTRYSTMSRLTYTMDRRFPGEGFEMAACDFHCGAGPCAQWVGAQVNGGYYYFLWVRLISYASGDSQYWLASEGGVEYPTNFRIFYNSPCDDIPPRPREVPPPRREPDIMPNCCSCETIKAIVLASLRPIEEKILELVKTSIQTKNILGGEAWFNSEESVSPQLTFNPEAEIESIRRNIFPTEKQAVSITVANILDWVAAINAVLYNRTGLHRLPAKLPESLTDEDREGQIEFEDTLSLQEWLFLQLDGILGQFPIKLKVRNAEGQIQDLKVENLSEIQAEILGILLGMSADLDISVELGMKAIVESIRATNAATVAYDYAKANCEYLGYKGKEEQRDVPMSITPKSASLRDALKPSIQKGAKFVFDDKEDLQDLLRRIALSTQIIQAVFSSPGLDDLPGDRIKQKRRTSDVEDNNKWTEFIAQIENPDGQMKRDDNAPKPDIKDLNIE